MQAKTFEIRDAGTFISALAVSMESSHAQESYLLGRAGYGRHPRLILLGRLDGQGSFHYSPAGWAYGTWNVAHEYIVEHWDGLETGAVIDVEFILGRRETPKVSERFE